MRSITPIDASLELIAHLERKKDRTELEDWLLHGFKLCRSGHARSLDEGLGLAVGPGEAHKRLCYVWRTRERNRLIREAATNLCGEYGKVQVARLIALYMDGALPDLRIVKHWETITILCKLRQICMNHKGDSPLALSWKRTIEIINGDGS